MPQSLKLFVNYRRGDHSDFVEHMRTWFMHRYGRENVFMDFDTIPPFARFEDFIKTKVRECDVVVSAIGPRWVKLLDERAASGKPDYVLIELEEALAYGKVIAPICIQGAPVPAVDEIPESLRPIFARNVASLRSGKDILDYIDGIMDALEAELAAQGQQRSVENPVASTSTAGEDFNIYEADDLYYKAVDVQDWPGALILLARMHGSGATIPDFFNLEQEETQLQAQIKSEEEARHRREVAEYLYGFVQIMAQHNQDVRAALKEIWAVEPGYDPDGLATKSTAVQKKKPALRARWWMKPRAIIVSVLIIAALAVIGELAASGGLRRSAAPLTPPSTQPIAGGLDTGVTETTIVSSPESTLNPATVLAEAGVTTNAGWTPYVQDFDGISMMLVPKGCFQMGSTDGYDDERPVHQVCLDKPFWIDRTEGTNGQFKRFGGQAGPPSMWGDESRPRESITWNESANFCQKRGVRLPTEAEWEYAARGPDGLTYPWGNTFIGGNAVWATLQTAEVGSKPGGASWVGALDMAGNVSEWVNDWYGSYSSAAQTNPNGPGSGQFRVRRGGSWNLVNRSDLRATFRDKGAPVPTDEGGTGGFRCARSY